MWLPWQSKEKQAPNMAIDFPNRSRSYDTTRRAVRFWGYSRCMESSFYVTADALKQIQPNLQSDAGRPAAGVRQQPRADLRDCRQGLRPRA